MRKLWCIILSITLIVPAFSAYVLADDSAETDTISYNYSYDFENGYNQSDRNTRQMEKLNRGLIAIKTDSGTILSWRLFDSEDNVYGSASKNVSFNIYRDNIKIASVKKNTFYTDTETGTSYSVAPVIDGIEGEKCEPVKVMNNSYFDIPLEKPAPETVTFPYPYTVTDTDGNVTATLTEATYSFFPADCSTGDVDGDGEYEIIVKWTSSERDVGEPGGPSYSGTVRFAAYKLNGTKLWANDINLGRNVYSSAHTVQFLVYDFDGDGKSEMICQTSLGSTDASGRYVSHASSDDAIAAFTDEQNEAADYRGVRYNDGRIISGEEFLTVFNGKTGEAIDTIDLPTSRGSEKGVDYGDDFGNRSNRFVSDVAYLDGQKPYAVYLRGYYFGRNGKQRTSIAGISFDGQHLSPDYRFDTQVDEPGYYEGAEKYVGNGNHNCTVADVDNDGKDEFITGALCMEVNDNNEFKPRWCTYKEHGDALHIGDYDPTHKGLEFFTVHEDGDKNNTTGGYGYTNAQGVWCDFGMSVIDADTGEILFHVPNSKDTGRGCMANTGSGGYYQITGVGSYQCNGNNEFASTRNGAGSNFRIFWDGDLYDELLDGTNITNYNGNGFNASNYDCVKINGTKSNPALQADLFGDWREELIYPTSDGNILRVFTTTEPTDYKIKTLMHDPVYRSGIAAQQTAYNQPPHVGFYLADEVFEAAGDGIKLQKITISSLPLKTTYFTGEEFDYTGLKIKAEYDDGTSEDITSDFTCSGYDKTKIGTQTITVTYKNKSAQFDIKVKELSVASLDATYETSSTASTLQTVPIGSYKGDFTIEQEVIINSLPAGGSNDKNSVDGFFMRFTPVTGVGAGWTLIPKDGNTATVAWKNDGYHEITSISVGETYTFRYDFHTVGQGINGAYVDMYIYNSENERVGYMSGLNLRNMSSISSSTKTPLSQVQIYNQASPNSAASVTLANTTYSVIEEGLFDVTRRSLTIDAGNSSSTVHCTYDGITKEYASDSIKITAQGNKDSAQVIINTPVSPLFTAKPANDGIFAAWISDENEPVIKSDNTEGAINTSVALRAVFSPDGNPLIIGRTVNSQSQKTVRIFIPKGKSGAVITSSYEGGTLSSVRCSVKEAVNENIWSTTGVISDNRTLKVMIWDSISGMKPLCDTFDSSKQ